jgi:hypothetical protein
MSRLHFSFDNRVAATLAENEAAKKRPLRLKAKFRSRRYMRAATENVGLFAFGFGSTNLIIHYAARFLAAPLSGILSVVNF